MSDHQKLHNHRLHNPMLEIIHESHNKVEQGAKALDEAELVKVSVRALAGGRAFREYRWLTDAVGNNRSGNLRGMVVSAKWRTAFTYTGEVGEQLENVGLLASFVAAVVQVAPEVDRIFQSTEAITVRGMRLTAIAGTAAQRALFGVVPAGVHLIYRSLEGWFMIGGLAGGRAQSVSSKCVSTVRRADTLVQTTFRMVTDTRNQAGTVWWVIDTVLSPRSNRSSSAK
jgi:uncharacterized protein YbcV (DUF1398 family)